jgi:adenine-specific DNA-methyltransferase
MGESDYEDPETLEYEGKDEFVNQTMLTCIGNKRKLINNIEDIVIDIGSALMTHRMNIVDGFAGSTVVSRMLSYQANNLYTNDLELYSYIMAQCYLETPTVDQRPVVHSHINAMNALAENGPFVEGIICKLYAPKETKNIQKDERCFYTRENALIIDTLRNYISQHVEPELAPYCLAPLLTKASIHTNTAGVFKGFYKKDDIGCFGGKAENALSRIMKPIRVDAPIWNAGYGSAFTPHCSNKDINTLIDELPDDIDIIYLDPPYNQHPYGSNYFMLNVIAKNEEPEEISKVSGIPKKWNKSKYNSHTTALESMRQLMEKCVYKSKFLLISYNNEGIISSKEWASLFEPYQVAKYEIKYDTFKGCRNLKDRSDKVVEIIYLICRRSPRPNR